MSKDMLDERRRGLEEEYFQKQSKALALKLRQKMEAEKLGQATGVTDADLLDAMTALGFGPETAALLPLVPLIQVAWASGEVTKAERKELLAIARARGIADGSEAHARLLGYLDQRPDRRFFDTALEMARAMIAAQGGGPAGVTDLVDLCRRVAAASGGLLGIHKVSAEEQAAIDKIAQQLQSDYAGAAADVVKQV